MPEILYNSNVIRNKIKFIFDAPKQSGRRVALVAYVGQDYAKYLPSPRGIEVICSPTAGATSVIAIDGLRKAKARVRFSDKLHMKVYWSEARGCVITSANLSANALGVRGLKEAGIWIEPDTVNIDKLLIAAQPYNVTSARINKLRREEERHKRAMASIGKRETDHGFRYIDWYKLESAAKTNWKLADFDPNLDYYLADAGKRRAKDEFNVYDPVNYHGVGKGEAQEGDWLLQVPYDYKQKNVIGRIVWMKVDFVVPIGRRERSRDKENPFQAVQVMPTSRYERPPFPLTPQFSKAFRAAAAKIGRNCLVPGTMKPSKRLLEAIADRFGR